MIDTFLFYFSQTTSSFALHVFDPDVVNEVGNMGIPQLAIEAAAGAAALVAGVGAFIMGKKKSSDDTTPAVAEEPEPVDVSIPYNAAAILAYEEFMGKTTEGVDPATFAKFEALYEEKVVAQVTAKKVARDFEDKIKSVDAELAKLLKSSTAPAPAAAAPAPAPVVAEKIDLSIPYDAAAKLAYDKSDKSMTFDAFKVQFEADAVADVIAKNAPAVDLSIPYDAAAKLAYDKSDKSMAIDAFKAKYEADAVADVIAKNKK
jgi:hypothetical protein